MRPSVWLVLLALGCQGLAGIEERHYEQGVTGSPECESYCDQVLAACTGTHASYATRDDCILTCAAFPSGEPQGDNSLECRAAQAALAEGTQEPQAHCPAAGPFGADGCGSTCEAYCALLGAACPGKHFPGETACEAGCAGLRSDKTYDLSQLGSGDTLECRVAQASLAFADSDRCEGAEFQSDVCKDDPNGSPNCDDVCNLIMAACTGSNAVYGSLQECKNFCATLDPGQNDATGGNTAACRKYHAYNAVADPITHCPHAGPDGGGVCS